ncbi:MAG: HEAT repeat domain-containing protein [Planctomycetota bacterium]|nr:HEAT repeat domain-containing protein [Planctomycetota bacterium]
MSLLRTLARPARAAGLLAVAVLLATAGSPPAQAADDLEGLVEAYEASVPAARDRSEAGYAAQSAALEDIAHLRTDDARKTLRRLLLEYGDGDYRQAALLLAALVRYGPPKDLDYVIDWVEGRKDPLMIEWLHEIVGAAQLPATREHLRGPALRGATPRVKIQIVRGLAAAADPAVISTLVDMTREADRDVRIEAVESLGLLGERSARPVVQVFLRDPEPHLRAAAARALGRLGDPMALPALERALQDEVARVVECAAEALGVLDDARAVPALIAGLARVAGTDLRLADAFTEALQRISGKGIPDDAELWLAWWATVKDHLPFEKAAEKPGTKTVGPTYHGFPVRSSRLIFVLDVSRSMGWNGRLDDAKQELVQVLDKLPPSTRFNVIVFSHQVWVWRDGLQPATSGNVRVARAWVRAQRPLLGTNTYGALKTAFGDPEADTVFLLSDGHPSEGSVIDPQVILNTVRSWNRLRGVRVHGIALLKGAAPAAFQALEDQERSLWFMQKLCAENHGRFREIR